MSRSGSSLATHDTSVSALERTYSDYITEFSDALTRRDCLISVRRRRSAMSCRRCAVEQWRTELTKSWRSNCLMALPIAKILMASP